MKPQTFTARNHPFAAAPPNFTNCSTWNNFVTQFQVFPKRERERHPKKLNHRFSANRNKDLPDVLAACAINARSG